MISLKQLLPYKSGVKMYGWQCSGFCKKQAFCNGPICTRQTGLFWQVIAPPYQQLISKRYFHQADYLLYDGVFFRLADGRYSIFNYQCFLPLIRKRVNKLCCRIFADLEKRFVALHIQFHIFSEGIGHGYVYWAYEGNLPGNVFSFPVRRGLYSISFQCW